jgi:hypothetical protein
MRRLRLRRRTDASQRKSKSRKPSSSHFSKIMTRAGTGFVFVVKIAPGGWTLHHIVMDQTGKFIAMV